MQQYLDDIKEYYEDKKKEWANKRANSIIKTFYVNEKGEFVDKDDINAKKMENIMGFLSKNHIL